MSDIVLGIDLGTTNSVVSIADGVDVRVLTDDGGSQLIPSVVSFHPDGRVLVGVDARDRRLVDAPNTIYSIKRLIGRPFRSTEVTEAAARFAFKFKESANGGVLVGARNETYTLTEISAFVLREVRRIAERAVGRPVTKAVITVPAAFNELQRSATKAAGRVAGLEVLRIVNEPTAAALAYGLGKARKERVAVYDLGGGTFDLTLLELEADVFEVLASAGDSFLGGDDFDTLLADAMCDEFLRVHRWDARQDRQAYERVRAAAEWLKCELSSRAEATVTIDDLAFGSKGTALKLEFTLDRPRFEAMIAPLVERSMEVCRKALAEAKLSPADLDAVILVGGSTRVPLVATRVREMFALDPRASLDPDLVVAQGAAIHGYALAGKKADKSIGRVALKRMTVQEVMAVQQQRQATRAAGPKQQAFATQAAPVQAAPAQAAPRVVRPEPPAGGRVAPKVPVPKAAPKPVVTAAAVPVLPPPKPRHSTMPPAPARAIEALDAPPRVAPVAPLPSAKVPFFPEPQHVRDIAALDTAVKRASIRPEASIPTIGNSALLTLDDLDDPLGPPALPPAQKPATRAAPVAPVAAAPAGVLPTMPAPIVRATLDPGLPVAAVPSAPAQPDPTPRALPALPPAPPPSKATIAFGAAPPPPPARAPQAPQAPQTPQAAPVTTSAEDDEPSIDTDDALPTLDAQEPAALPMTAVAAPLLLDVTPLSLGVETVGGYCQTIIRRNVPIPCEQTRTFTTAADRQTTVVVRICQGESRQMAENQLLGLVELSGLRAAARGQVRIAVTFVIDASGILDVKAVDEATGEAQATRVQLLGGASDADVEAMRARQQRLVGR